MSISQRPSSVAGRLMQREIETNPDQISIFLFHSAGRSDNYLLTYLPTILHRRFLTKGGEVQKVLDTCLHFVECLESVLRDCPRGPSCSES